MRKSVLDNVVFIAITVLIVGLLCLWGFLWSIAP